MKPKTGKGTLVTVTFAAAAWVLGAPLVVGTEGGSRDTMGPAASMATPGESRPAQQALVKGLLIDLDLARLNRAANIELEKDELFAIRVPKAPPPPIPTQIVIQAPPPPPAKPVAPPLPFKYLGQMLDRGQLIVFVARGDDLLSLRQGDVLANQYRVDAATDASVTFIYLPLDERQTLAFGSRQ